MVAGVPVVKHVSKSVMPLTVTVTESSTLKSAMDGPGGRVLISTTRKRNLVNSVNVLLTKRRLIDIVPFAPLGTGVRSRTRFGATDCALFESSRCASINRVRRGAPEF